MMQVMAVPQAVAFAPQAQVVQQIPIQTVEIQQVVQQAPAPIVDSNDINLRILHVIDPANRSGKIDVPFTQTFDTVGRTEWLSRGLTGKKDISLCMLFQQRRCNAGTKCNQIHAERSLIQSLRQAADTVPRCCLKHGDVHSANDQVYLMRLRNLKGIQLQCANGAVFDVPTTSFGRTNSFEALLMKGEPVIVVSASRICRLQQRNCCKYGKDCKNIHICREVGKLLPEANPTGAQNGGHFDQTVSDKNRAVVPSLPMPATQSPASKKRNNQRSKRRFSKESQLTNTTATSCATEQLPATPEEIELSGSAKFGKGFTLTESSLKTFQEAFKFPPQKQQPSRKQRRNVQERKRNKKDELHQSNNNINLGNSYGSSMFGESMKLCLPTDLQNL